MFAGVLRWHEVYSKLKLCLKSRRCVMNDRRRAEQIICRCFPRGLDTGGGNEMERWELPMMKMSVLPAELVMGWKRVAAQAYTAGWHKYRRLCNHWLRQACEEAEAGGKGEESFSLNFHSSYICHIQYGKKLFCFTSVLCCPWSSVFYSLSCSGSMLLKAGLNGDIIRNKGQFRHFKKW